MVLVCGCGLFICCGLGCLFVSVWFVYGVFVNSVVHYDFFLFVVGCLIAVLAVGCLLCC